jgi:hypothetical protein
VNFEYFHGENSHRGNLSIFRFMALLFYFLCRILNSMPSVLGSNASISVSQ